MIDVKKKNSHHSPKGWNTEREMAYLDRIGQELTRPVDKNIILTGYIASCKKRVNWGDIDKRQVLAYAKRLLDKIS